MKSAPITPNFSKHPINFKANLNSIRYVRLNGELVESKELTEEISRKFAQCLRKGNIMNDELRTSLARVMPEYHSLSGTQPIKFFKSTMIGRDFNIIIGEPAYRLQKIWEQANIGLEIKKRQAGNLLSSVIHGNSKKFIAIDVISETVKNKVKYIFKKIYTTI